MMARKFLICALAVLLCSVSVAKAEKAKAKNTKGDDSLTVQLEDQKGKDGGKKEKKDLPKTGVLALYMSSASTNVKAPLPWGGVDASGDKPSPLTASILKREDGWIIRIVNNSTDKGYSANFEFASYDAKGKKIKSDPFSYSLKPGERVERPSRGTENTAAAQVALTSWKEQ